MESGRLPRFKRSSAVIPIRLTERDHHILRHVRRHRFLLSDHIDALVPGSRQQILRRLQRLFHHGYLDRPRSQLEYFHQGGSKSIVYGLDRKGAKLFSGESAQRRLRCDSKHPMQPTKQVYLQHSLLVSAVMVALENSCARSGTVRLVREEELAASTNLRESFRWTVTVHSRRLGLRPDNVFGLEHMQTGERSYYFLEADRATMPVVRRALTQSSFQRKLLAYEATWRQDIHRSRFGFHRFRVLTVTSNAERVRHLIEACSKLRRAHGIFLFADFPSLQRHGDPLTMPWQSARHSVETLISHPRAG